MPRAEAQLVQLPVQIGKPTAIQTNGQTYLIPRFAKDVEDAVKGPTLQQMIDLTKKENERRRSAGEPLVEMLEIREARAIRDNDESNAAFRKVFKLGDWANVRDSESESRSRAAYLVHYKCDGRLYVDDDNRPDVAAPVGIWKVVGSEAAAPKVTQILRIGKLCVKKGEALKATPLPDGAVEYSVVKEQPN